MNTDPIRSQQNAPHDAAHDGPEISVQDARQGRSGVRILLVLVVSALATATLLGLLWLFSNGGFQRVDAETTADTAAATAPQAIPNGTAPPPSS